MSADTHQNKSGHLVLSPLILGTMDRKRCTDEERIRLFREAFSRGITAFDTAPLYDFGRAEIQLGRALRSIPRDEAQVLTKVGLNWDGDTHGDVLFHYTDEAGAQRGVRKDSRPAIIHRDVISSLERLGVDTIDLVQVHHPDLQVPMADTMGTLLDLRKEGKVSHIGVSNFSPRQVEEAQAALGDVPLATVQQAYSLIQREVELELLPLCLGSNIGLIAYSPLAEGLLAGRPPRSSHPAFGRITQAVKSILQPIAETHEVSPAAVALSWLVSRQGVTSAITGASSPEQLAQQLPMLDLQLSAAELDSLDQGFAGISLPEIREMENGFARRVARRGKRGLGKALRMMGIDTTRLRERMRSGGRN